ncbi:MAG TPA: PAS domain-containing protein [Caldimonas sp.]|nr:PAS domain-containing protein [Caldimonas sp.]
MTGQLPPGPAAELNPLLHETSREQALLADAQAASRRLAEVLESVSDSFVALDRDWRYTAVNGHGAETLRKSRDEILGRSIWHLFPDLVGSSFEAELRRAFAQQTSVLFEYLYPGHDRWYECRVYPAADGVSVFFADITERKRAEEALRQSDARFRALSENTSLLVWTCTADRRCDYVSPQFERYTGVSLLGGWRLERVHADDHATLFAAWERSTSEGVSTEFELRLQRHDGVWRWFQMGLVPLFAPGNANVVVKWLGVSTDIDDRKRVFEALTASEARLATDMAAMKRLQEVSTRLVRDGDDIAPLLEIVDAAIAITGADMGNIQLLDPAPGSLRIVASRGFERPFLDFFDAVPAGEAASSAAMRTAARVVVDDVAASALFVATPALDVMLAAGVRAVQSTPLITRSGRLVGMLSTHHRAPRVPQDRDLHLLDVLARQAADWIERTQAQDELVGAKKALEAADRRKDEFLAVLAHELRNPLAAITTGSHVLRRLPASASEWMRTRDMIEQQASHLARLVDDLLEVSHITAGRIVMRHESLDLRDVVRHAIDGTRSLLATRRHALRVDLPGEPVRVQGDAVRIGEVVSNLLSNAAKYTPEEGSIRLVVEATPEHASVRVVDSGIGVAADELPRIFELFNRIDRSRHLADGGLGIGLTLSRRLMEMHRGSLEVFSEGAGRGSEFVARLPLADRGGGAAPPSASPRRAAAPSRARRILLVDDNEPFTTAMTSLLRAKGHDVHAVHDGAIAVATVRAVRPDAVLLDIALPGKRGDEIAREIRADPALAGMLIVAVTGYGQEGDKHAAQNAGFDHHLTKPVDEIALEALLVDAPSLAPSSSLSPPPPPRAGCGS